ncbi:MAG: glycosyltransferase family 4 protein [Bacteroidales bacterium]|nr:glycosyltransferase family 4 protein [Bacteroidales bacterium]
MNEKLEKQKPRICFVSLNSYPLLKGKNFGYVGGAEMQQVKIANELKERGYEISFITYGEDQTGSEIVNGIEIIPAYERKKVHNLGSLSKILMVWKKMKNVDADVYFYRTGFPGVTSIFARLNKKKNVNFISSDVRVTGKLMVESNILVGLFKKITNWLDIKLSDIVVSQNMFQELQLNDKFNVESIVIKNAIDMSLVGSINGKPEYLLWVGTIRAIKQPDLFLQIARHFPEHRFLIIGGEGDDKELFNKIKNDAGKIQNLEFIGFVSHKKIFEYYKKALALVSTSKTEGFPNVFLEAWVHSIPVISLSVDPDGIISKYKLGFHSKNFYQMIDDIRTLLKNTNLRMEMGVNARKYVEKKHNIKRIVDQYENLIGNVLKKNVIYLRHRSDR